LILAPILLFSGLNPGMVVNPVQAAKMEIRFELGNNVYNIYSR
jgi:hypothetical protein